MKLTITIADNMVKISHNDYHEFSFDLSDIVNLNEFIKYISENEGKIECDPKTFKDFRDGVQDITEEMLKLVEYIFKILVLS